MCLPGGHVRVTFPPSQAYPCRVSESEPVHHILGSLQKYYRTILYHGTECKTTSVLIIPDVLLSGVLLASDVSSHLLQALRHCDFM